MEARLGSFVVEVEVAQADDQLRPRYAAGSGLLLLESGHVHDWPNGATVDGILTLDLTAGRVLANVELVWPRERWPRGERRLPPREMPYRRLLLPALESNSVDERTEVQVSSGSHGIAILLGPAVADERFAVGPGVDALLSGRGLAGFVVDRSLLSISP